LEDLGLDGWIILKLSSTEYIMGVSTGFTALRIRYIGKVLRTQ